MSDPRKLSWATLGPKPLPDEQEGPATLRAKLARSDALRNLLDQAAAAGEAVLLVVNDGHRATQTRLALTTLGEVIGPRPRGLRFRALVATGTHRFADDERREFEGETFDGCGVNIEQVAWHDADDDDALTDVGGVRIHEWLARGRFIVPIGSVEPHYFAGVTGAHKTVTIGCQGREAIERNHAKAMEPTADILRLEGNPVFDDIMRALGVLKRGGKQLYAINEVVRGDALVSAAVGGPRDTLEELLPIVRHVFWHDIPKPVDVLHLKVPPPLGRNLYQADKALKNNHLAVRDGGGIILEADCPEGVGPDAFVNLLRRAADYAAARRIVREEGYRLGDHKAVRLRYLTDRAGRNVRVALVSPHLAPDVARVASMHLSSEADSALAWLSASVVGRVECGLAVEDAGVVGIAIADK